MTGLNINKVTTNANKANSRQGNAHNFKDELGQKYERLIVIGQCGRYNNEVTWLCRCDCGNEITVRGISLRKKRTRSCGCLHKEQLIDHNIEKTNPNKQVCKQKAVALRQQGLSYAAIAQIFNQETFPTLSGKGAWYGSTIRWLVC